VHPAASAIVEMMRCVRGFYADRPTWSTRHPDAGGSSRRLYKSFFDRGGAHKGCAIGAVTHDESDDVALRTVRSSGPESGSPPCWNTRRA